MVRECGGITRCFSGSTRIATQWRCNICCWMTEEHLRCPPLAAPRGSPLCAWVPILLTGVGGWFLPHLWSSGCCCLKGFKQWIPKGSGSRLQRTPNLCRNNKVRRKKTAPENQLSTSGIRTRLLLLLLCSARVPPPAAQRRCGMESSRWLTAATEFLLGNRWTDWYPELRQDGESTAHCAPVRVRHHLDVNMHKCTNIKAASLFMFFSCLLENT